MGVLDKLGDMFNSVSQGPNTGPPSQGFKEGAPKDYKPNRIGEGGGGGGGSILITECGLGSRDACKHFTGRAQELPRQIW